MPDCYICALLVSHNGREQSIMNVRPPVRRLSLLVTVFFLITLVVPFAPPPRLSHAATTFTVNTAADASDSNVGDGTCSTAASECSLRAAIEEANALAGDDTILFNGDYTITLSSQISLSSNITIDGEDHQVAVDGGGTTRVFSTPGSGTFEVSLKNLTIQNGRDTAAQNNGAGLSALSPDATFNIENCSFLNNQLTHDYAGQGGAIYNHGVLNVKNSLFRGNHSTFSGSAVMNKDTGTATFENTVFTENTTLRSVTLSNSGTAIVKHCTFLNNSTTGDATQYHSINLGGTISLYNNVIVSNDDNPACVDSGGTVLANENNWIDDGTCDPKYSGDPYLGALQDNGGKTLSVAPTGVSPLIDAIPNGEAGCGTELTTDQRGQPRPDTAGGACDIGAVDVPAVENLFRLHQPANLVLGQPDFASNATGTGLNQMNTAHGVAMDPTTGKIFVADYNNSRVLRFASGDALASGDAAELVVATTTSSASAVEVDDQGTLWVCDYAGNIKRYDNASSLTATATTPDATLNGVKPLGLMFDAEGQLWISEPANNRVLRIDDARTDITGTVADVTAIADGVLGQPDMSTTTAGTTASKMDAPRDMVIDSQGTLWISEYNNHRVLRFDDAASKTNGAAADGVLGQADFTSGSANRGGSPAANTLNSPDGLTIDPDGNLYLADRANHRILIFNDVATKRNGSDADNTKSGCILIE